MLTGESQNVAPLGDDKKIVLHRIVLKLSGPCNIAQTCILYEWVNVTRLLWWVDRVCYNVTSAVRLAVGPWTMSQRKTPMFQLGHRDPLGG